MSRVARKCLAWLLAAVVVSTPFSPVVAGDHDDRHEDVGKTLHKIEHFVVIYQENHSFDNLYGGWEGVRGLRHARAAQTTQISQDGQIYDCLMQNDVNLASPPLAMSCHNTHGGSFTSAFVSAPFQIDQFIAPTDKTCPPENLFAANGVLKDSPGALPGGCTKDIVHRFYQEQYQINGGQMNRYMTGSDAVGLTMGHYDTKQLPIYKYLHAPGHPTTSFRGRSVDRS